MASRPSLFGFLVCRRTSVWEGRPCDEAKRVEFLRADRRRYIDKSWLDIGKNHRVENGEHVRDLDDTRWVVRIPNADALQAFCERYGRVIIALNLEGVEPCYELEIYDTYRE